MNHLLSFKLPTGLFSSLEATAKQEGVSKGALVRKALEKFLNKPTSKSEQIKKITKGLLMRKKISPPKIDWNYLREKVSTKQRLSPEEEVLASRRRNL
ncbi:MAG: hypothetical protein HYU97_02605 [Deltaproteobacteria bacterium]|nr:hypothetical protein [Deltaproteobacteria bacterium]